jgi:hypothetical protein
MTDASGRRALFLAATAVAMLLAVGVAFNGSAAAEVDSVDGIDADDVSADQDSVAQEVVLRNVSGDGDDEIIVSPDRGTISHVSVENPGSFDFSGDRDVFVPSDENRFELVVTADSNQTSDITVEVTLNTSGVSSAPAEYTADTAGGASASGDFQIQSSSDSTAPSPTVDTDASSVTPTETTTDETQEYTVDVTIDDVLNEAATVDILIDDFTIFEDGNPEDDASIDYGAEAVTNGTASFSATFNATATDTPGSRGVAASEIRLEDGNEPIYEDFAEIDSINVQDAPSDGPLTVNNDGSADYESIQNAVDNASEGATIEIEPGVYNESVDVNVQNVTLVGPNAGTPGDAERSEEAIVRQGVKLNASGVTFDGFWVETNATNAVRIGPEVVPDDVTIQNNVITNVGGGDFLRENTPTGAGNGIQVQFNSGEPTGETAENLRILNNEINNVTTLDTEGGTTAVGINILPRGNNVDLEIRGNTIRDIEPGSSSNDEAQARAISIDTQDDEKSGDGRVNGAVIENNDITGLAADDDVWAISIFEDGSLDPKEGVENFTISENTFDDFDADVEEVALFVGGYAELGSEHQFTRNNVQDGAIARIGGENEEFDSLNATNNWWGSENGPRAAENAYEVGDQGVGVTDGVEFTPWLDASTNDGGEEFAPITSDSGGEFASIQTAVDAAGQGETVAVGRGEFTESVEIETQSISVVGAGDSTTINGSVALSADETSLSDVRVESFVGDVFPGPADENNAVNVGGEEVQVDDVTVDLTAESEGFVEGIGIEVFGTDASAEISNSTVNGVAQSTTKFDGVVGGDGVVGISVDQGARATAINNTIDVESEGYSFAVVAREGAETNVLFNDLSASGEAENLNGVGFGVEGANPEAQFVRYNSFEDIDSIEHKSSGGTLDLTVNNWEDPGEVQFLTFDSGGEIIYDPVLTEEKSVNNSNDLIREEDGQPIATTSDYGSYIELEVTDGATLIGFPAPSEDSLGELLDDDIVEAEDGSAVQAFVYDNTDGEFESIDGSFTPTGGEVVAITTEDGLSDEFVVPVDTDPAETVNRPGQTQLGIGYNLVAAGAANDTEEFGVVTSDPGNTIVEADVFQAQARQPGAPEATFGAYSGTWILTSDGTLSTGYNPGTPPSVYFDEVLMPETEDNEAETTN